MVPSSRTLAALVVTVTSLTLGGCETLGYYSQAAGGQLQLVYRRQPVSEVLARLDRGDLSEADRQLKDQLLLSQELLAFAESEIGLDVGQRYRTYVELDEPSVVWNLFAAPELSLEPRTWCYPFVGCAPYRGYFDRDRAERYRARLERQGFDTYLGGAAAYSTLGWFNDPLLSSFIRLPEANLADLLFHELAHSRVWVSGDVAFNEAFASFVGRRGMALWLKQEGRESEYREFLRHSAQRRHLMGLLLETRRALEAVYASPQSAVERWREKRRVLAAARACYRARPDHFGGAGYARLFEELNNALLVSVATYEDLYPAFAALYAQSGSSWSAFFDAAEKLGKLDEEARSEALRRLSESRVAHDADDDGTDQVQCQSLPGHGLDAEAAGTEDDDVGRRGDRQHERA
jgi:predicted aminopeptidase